MPEPGRLRRLDPTDLPACLDVAESRDWGRERRKWELLFRIGDVWGIEAGDRGLAGTVVLTRFGRELAVVGMLLVAPSHGRRGLGRRMMEHVIAEAGDAVVFLYATAEGLPLYERLGFVTVDTLTKHVGRMRHPPAHAPGVEVRRATASDLEDVVRLDSRACGAPRQTLLEALLAGAEGRAALATRDGRPAGYALTWLNEDVTMLGPLVASDDDVARTLVTHVAADAAHPVRIDFPSRFASLMAEAQAWGLARQPPCPAMTLRGRPLPGDRALLYAPAAQAFG